MTSSYKNLFQIREFKIATNHGVVLHFFSFMFAAFVVFFPWEIIMRSSGTDGFNDFTQYLKVFSSAQYKMDMYQWTTLVQFFTGELLWDNLIRSLSLLTSPYFALRTASFLICYIWALITFKNIPFLWGLVFLLNPTSIDVAMSGIRNGFAFALFLFSFFYLSGARRIMMFSLTPFFHSSAAGLIAIYFSIKFWFKGIFKTRVILFSERTRSIIIAVVPGIILGIALTVLADVVLSFLGDRRVGLASKSQAPSITQSLFWYTLLCTQLTCSVQYIKRNAFTINLIVWYLILNTSISWSYRIWGATIPIIAISIWNLPKQKRQLIMLMWIAYLILWYVYWTKLLNFFIS